MSYEEEFDSIIRKKLSEAEYPFDENNWGKTNGLLDAQRLADRKLLYKKIIIPASLLVTGAVIFVLALGNSGMAESSGNGLLTDNAPASGSSAVRTEDKTRSSSPDALLLSPASQERAAAASEQSKIEPDRKNHGAAPSEATANPPYHPQSVASILQDQPTPSGSTAQGKNPVEVTVDNVTPQSVSPVSEKSIPAFEEKPDASNAAKESVPQQEGEDIMLAAAIDQEAVRGFGFLNSHSLYLPFEQNNAAITPFEMTILKRYEDDYYSKKAKTHFLNVEFGAAYLLGWQSSAGKDAQGFNGFLGVNYGYYFSKFSVSLGAQAYNISNIRSAFYDAVKKEYGFGYSNAYTSITARNLYYVSAPVRLTFHAGNLTSFGAGINAGYLVRSENTVSKYELADGSRNERSSQDNHHIYEGVNNLNIMGSAFLNARVNSRLGLALEFNYSFTDIFSGTESINYKQNPVGFRLGMQYYLFDK